VPVEPLAAAKALTTIITLGRSFAFLRNTRKRRQFRGAVERVDQILSDLIDACAEPSSPRALRLQQEAREMYDRLSELANLDGSYNGDGFLDYIVNAIAAARIFYWLRTFDGEKTLDSMTLTQLQAECAREDITRSHAAAVRQVLQWALDGSEPNGFALRWATDECLQAVAQFRTELIKRADWKG